MFIATADEITFSTHLVTRSKHLRAFCSHPVFQGLTGDLIGPDVRLYWDQAVYKKPRTATFVSVAPGQRLHLPRATAVSHLLGCVDRQRRSGTVVRGWCRASTTGAPCATGPPQLGFQCLEDPDDAVAVPARAGSIVVFSSLTPHATGPNQSESIRKAYIVQFAPNGAQCLKDDAGGWRTDPREPGPTRASVRDPARRKAGRVAAATPWPVGIFACFDTISLTRNRCHSSMPECTRPTGRVGPGWDVRFRRLAHGRAAVRWRPLTHRINRVNETTRHVAAAHSPGIPGKSAHIPRPSLPRARQIERFPTRGTPLFSPFPHVSIL